LIVHAAAALSGQSRHRKKAIIAASNRCATQKRQEPSFSTIGEAAEDFKALRDLSLGVSVNTIDGKKCDNCHAGRMTISTGVEPGWD
jgi:hypothetical protein